MKKFLVACMALFASLTTINAQDQGCVPTLTTLSGTASIKFVRYTHRELPGVFAVSATKSVRFSQGNLQYRASTNVWRFALNQWDVIAEDNANAAENYDGWIDLFGWGTSGCSTMGATAYQPWSTSATASDYYSATSLGNNGDWSAYNKILNGGGAEGPAAGLWRVLSESEWDYLFNERDGANSTHLFGYGSLRVNGMTEPVKGIFLLPDGWNWARADIAAAVTDAGFTWVSAADETGRGSNVITNSALWEVLENAGVVFLPVTGQRTGTTVEYTATYGFYWQATATKNHDYARRLQFSLTTSSVSITTKNKNAKRNLGLAVRPVMDVETGEGE